MYKLRIFWMLKLNLQGFQNLEGLAAVINF